MPSIKLINLLSDYDITYCLGTSFFYGLQNIVHHQVAFVSGRRTNAHSFICHLDMQLMDRELITVVSGLLDKLQ